MNAIQGKPVRIRTTEPSRFIRLLYPVTAVILAIVGWAGFVELFKVPAYILPPPQDVYQALIEKVDILFRHSRVTVYSTLGGLSLSIVIGVPFAMLLVWSRTIERAIMPLLVFSQCFPKIAIGPLLIVWFGWGIFPKVLISFIIAFFPIVIQTALGLKSVENDELDLIRIMSPSAYQVFTKIRIPNALPYFFGGLKVAVTLSLIGAIVGEFIGSDSGLGYLLQFANTELDTELLFAALVFLMVLGGILFLVVIQLEKWLWPWHVAVRGENRKGVRVSEEPVESAS
jgi:NitT/TauT family transport system permease protein